MKNFKFMIVSILLVLISCDDSDNYLENSIDSTEISEAYILYDTGALDPGSNPGVVTVVEYLDGSSRTMSAVENPETSTIVILLGEDDEISNVFTTIVSEKSGFVDLYLYSATEDMLASPVLGLDANQQFSYDFDYQELLEN